MAKKIRKRPLALALGAAFAATLAGTGVVNAADNPFAMTELSNGYMVAESAEGKCGEGKCGGAKGAAKSVAEGKCGEGKCGGAKGAVKSNAEGKCGGARNKAKSAAEGKCGEGKCGGSK
jgi:uncharacterized low-complexity protein